MDDKAKKTVSKTTKKAVKVAGKKSGKVVKEKKKPGGQPGPKRLTVRDRKTVKGLIEGKSVRRAMIDAGFTENTANVKGKEKLEKLKPVLAELMEKRGLSDDKFLEVLEEGLDATRPVTVSLGQGMGSDIVDYSDFGVRHKYLETGLKLKGHLQPDTLNTNMMNAPASITIVVDRRGLNDRGA